MGMGTRDLIKGILAELGTVQFGRIAFKPGKPTTFATVGDKLTLNGYLFTVTQRVSNAAGGPVAVRP